MKMYISIHVAQARRILELLELGGAIHTNFAMHDDWHEGMDPKLKQATKDASQGFRDQVKRLRSKLQEAHDD